MSTSDHGGPQFALAQEAARLICEERMTDYRAAKLKAVQRLGLGPRTPLPDNASVRDAVLDYQRLFGGKAYATHLAALRETALQAMKLLEQFEPRLVGGAVSGAISLAHRAQLHAFCEKPETLDLFLQNLGIPYRQAERDYRYADGHEVSVPLVCFEAGDIGLDVAIFAIDDQRRAPLDPADGLAYRRLDLRAAEKLINAEP